MRHAVCGIDFPFSIFRTMTVGFGFSPNLLTLSARLIGARGLVLFPLETRTYRRWGIAPRPENFAANGGARQYRKKAGILKAYAAIR
jgi:hypothetical protein